MWATGTWDGMLAKDRKMVEVNMTMLDLDSFSCIQTKCLGCPDSKNLREDLEHR